VSERRNLQRRLQQLAEIRSIMDAMRNLALAEMLKLKPRLDNQHRMAADLESMAADFLCHHPYAWPGDSGALDIWIVFGSERGFCGDFNETLCKAIEQLLQSAPGARIEVILIGNKLVRRFAERGRNIHGTDGAEVTEEVTGTLNHVVNRLGNLQLQYNTINVHALFHDADTGILSTRQLLPPFTDLKLRPARHGTPPLLHLPPAVFFSALVDEYLYFALHEIAYASLLAENNRRIQHMTGALRRLDESSVELTRQYHFHRQEEITEELEVILLNSSTT
jgi:F-type H+-transporting ATPase subunit gamma